MRKLLLFVASTVFAAAAYGQQYKWVDKDGRVQYGDAPPPGASPQRLRPPPAGTPEAPAAKGPLTPAEQEAAFRKRQQDAEKDRDQQAQADRQAQARQDNCSRAQAALRNLESGQRISRTDAKGERYILDDAQIAQETAQVRQAVKESCS